MTKEKKGTPYVKGNHSPEHMKKMLERRWAKKVPFEAIRAPALNWNPPAVKR